MAIDFSRDALSEATPDRLMAIKHACAQRDAILLRLDGLNQQVARLQQDLDTLEQRRIPELMAECGMTAFTLSDGRRVTVREMLYAGVTRDNMPAALAWLRRTGNDAIIRHTVGVRFGKDDSAAATRLAAELLERYGLKLETINEQTLHPSTLRAFVRERLAAESADTPPAELLPRELFGVYAVTKAEVKERDV